MPSQPRTRPFHSFSGASLAPLAARWSPEGTGLGGIGPAARLHDAASAYRRPRGELEVSFVYEMRAGPATTASTGLVWHVMASGKAHVTLCGRQLRISVHTPTMGQAPTESFCRPCMDAFRALLDDTVTGQKQCQQARPSAAPVRGPDISAPGKGP